MRRLRRDNIKVQELADEQALKVGQNVAVGVLGLLCGRCCLQWTLKAQPAKKWLPYRHVSNILQR